MSVVQVGEVIEGKYRIERSIGTGAMGAVFAATHLELGQIVAMKFLLAEGTGTPEVAARFMREARAVAQIRSEHVARVVDVGRLASGSPYIVMEYLDGEDLDERLRRGPLGVEEATDYVIQACDAMAAAHRLGIVHRDLKPANLFLSRQLDGSDLIKVLDFGISKSLSETSSGALTSAGALVGSPLYMSPEQIRSARDVDLRSDIWSLGAVLFELLAARAPFLGDSIITLIHEITLGTPASLAAMRPDLPPELVQAVMRCLEKDPALRFGDVAEMARALAPFATPRAQLSVERVFRIVGSVPPSPPGRISSVPTSGAPYTVKAVSLPGPPPLGSLANPHGSMASRPASMASAHASIAAEASLATAGTVVGLGTAPGWTGTEAPRPRRRRGPLLALALLVPAAAVAGGYVMLNAHPSPGPLDRETLRSAPAAAPSPPGPSAAPARADAPPVTVAPAAVSSAANVVASASASAAASSQALATKPHQKLPVQAAPGGPSTTSEPPKRGGLSMDIK